MTKRPDVPSLAAGVILGLAACLLAAIHVAIPEFIPSAVLVLLGISGGVTLPTFRQPAPSSSTVAEPVPATPGVRVLPSPGPAAAPAPPA